MKIKKKKRPTESLEINFLASSIAAIPTRNVSRRINLPGLPAIFSYVRMEIRGGIAKQWVMLALGNTARDPPLGHAWLNVLSERVKHCTEYKLYKHGLCKINRRCVQSMSIDIKHWQNWE